MSEVNRQAKQIGLKHFLHELMIVQLNIATAEDHNALEEALVVRQRLVTAFRTDTEGRDLTDLPGLWSESDITDSSLSRNLQQQQLTQALGVFKGNKASFRNALLEMAAESGRQLGHEMAIAEMNAALATHAELQQQVGKGLGVVAAADTAAPSA
jgi:hypothetical protein